MPPGMRARAKKRLPTCNACSVRSCVRQRGDDQMRVLFIAAAATAVFWIAVRPAQSQAIPDLNVDPVCRGIAQQATDPSEKGGPDLPFTRCVQSEQGMRQKLVN